MWWLNPQQDLCILLLIYLPVKYILNKKEATEEKLIRIFDPAVTLTHYNQHCALNQDTSHAYWIHLHASSTRQRVKWCKSPDGQH